MHKVFVYGTLKKGGYFHYAMKRMMAKFLKDCVTKEICLFSAKGAYPFVLHQKSDVGTVGEIFEVDDKGLKQLDAIEGHPGFYKREEIQLENDKCWVYLAPKQYEDLKKIQITEFKV